MEEASTPIVAQRALARGVIGNGGLVNDPTTSSSGDRGSSPDLTGKLPLPIGAIVGAGSSGEGGLLLDLSPNLVPRRGSNKRSVLPCCHPAPGRRMSCSTKGPTASPLHPCN